ncbi:MAG: MBL fold metallo-hydrolase [Candidatus Brocadiia bacterium]
MAKVLYDSVLVGDLEVNCYILWTEGSTEAIVLDPGASFTKINRRLKALKLTPAIVALTHGHCDHIGAVAEMLAAYPGCRLAAHREEIPLLKQPTLNMSWFFNQSVQLREPDIILEDNSTLDMGEIHARVFHVPGHSPGGVAFYVQPEGASPLLFCGDILFKGSVGRTDFHGGSWPMLIAGIREKLLVLPANTIVLPGHGDPTTIGAEIKTNPFLNGEHPEDE